MRFTWKTAVLVAAAMAPAAAPAASGPEVEAREVTCELTVDPDRDGDAAFSRTESDIIVNQGGLNQTYEMSTGYGQSVEIGLWFVIVMDQQSKGEDVDYVYFYAKAGDAFASGEQYLRSDKPLRTRATARGVQVEGLGEVGHLDIQCELSKKARY